MVRKKSNDLLKAEHPKGKTVVLLCLLVFGVSLFPPMIAAIVNKVYPFGNWGIYYADLIAEYLPFIYELYDKVRAADSLFFTWRSCLGISFVGDFYYYISSPLNLLVLLFKRSLLQDVVTALIVLRQAAAGAFMTYYLCRRRKGAVSFYSAVCGLLYAFSGWYAAYYQNIIWLDAYMLLPLLILGLEKLIDDGDVKVFIPVLMFNLFSNVYISYLVIVFAIIYWLYYYFSNYNFAEYTGIGKKREKVPFFKSRFFNRGFLFAMSGFFSVLALSFEFVPFLLFIKQNSVNEFMDTFVKMFMNLSQQAAALYSGSKANVLEMVGYANVYIGVLPLAVLPLLRLTENMSKREKNIILAIFIFFFCSFNIPFLDLFWHLFRFPNGYPFRESMFFAFFAIMICHRVLISSEVFSDKRSYLKCGAAFVALMLFGIRYLSVHDGQRVITKVGFFVTAGLFIAFCVILFIPKKTKAIRTLCFALAMILSFGDVSYTLSRNILIEETLTHDDIIVNYNAAQKLISKQEKDNFHRMEFAHMWSLNDGVTFGFNGIKTSTSTCYTDLLEFMQKLGIDTNCSNYSCYYPQTNAFNTLFGFKYLIERMVWDGSGMTTYADHKEEGYSALGEAGDFRQFSYDYALPLGFAADTALESWEPVRHKAVENQNSFFKLAAGCEDILVDDHVETVFKSHTDTSSFEDLGDGIYTYSVSEEEAAKDDDVPTAVFDFTVKRDGPFYIYLSKDTKDDRHLDIKIEKKNKSVTVFGAINTEYMSAVCRADAGDKISVLIFLEPASSGKLAVRGFGSRAEENIKAYNTLMSNGGYEITKFNSSHIDGTIDVKGDKKLFTTTIPYDKGWKITVDGETLPDEKIIKTGGELISFEISGGKHTVSFDFVPYGFKAGVTISALTLAAGAAYTVLSRRKKKQSGEEE
ncbi:MAG: YfhO family protein [Clostridiales bacterium]|nr:YfhO family protein [Clostridiales bacterium]